LAVLADVGDGAAQPPQQRLGGPERGLGPPTMIARVPFSVAGTLPETGASIIVARAARTRVACAWLARGLTSLAKTSPR
jgi:hypothetical protein